MALQGKAGSAGSLMVSLVAVEALRAATGETTASSGGRAVAGGRASPRSQGVGAAAGASEVRVDVGSMVLAPTVKRDLEVANVWVEVDLLGLAEASQLRTKRVHKSSVNLDFGFSTAVDVAGAGASCDGVNL